MFYLFSKQFSANTCCYALSLSVQRKQPTVKVLEENHELDKQEMRKVKGEKLEHDGIRQRTYLPSDIVDDLHLMIKCQLIFLSKFRKIKLVSLLQ